MNANKLLSAMIIAVMVASVCAVPFAAAEEPAAEDESVLKEGDSYGLWINISKADIYRIANEAIGTDLIKIDDNYIKGLIESEIKKTDENAKNISITFDFNAKAGIAASIITVTDEVNTYRATGIVDATLILNGSYETVAEKYIDVPPGTDDEEISDYIEDHKDSIEENKTLNVRGNASINLGIAIDASISVDNETGMLKSIDGKIGVYVEMKSESSRYDSYEDVYYKVDDKDEMYGNMYIEAKSFEKDGVTMIQGNGINSGFGDMDDMFFDVDEMEEIETPFSAEAVEGTLSSIKSITEINGDMLEIVAGIINEKKDILAKLPDEIKNKEGKLNTDLIKTYLPAINKVFGFIFGDDGLALTDKEVSDIRQSASDVLNIGMSKISFKEFTVEFYPDLLSVDDPTKVVKKTVKFGNPVEMTDDVKGFMNAPEGKVFIGWYACVFEDGEFTIEFEGPNAIGMVTCDMKLVPVFADKKMSIEAIYDALDDQDEEEIFASLGNDDKFDATKLEGKDNVHIEISNDSTVGSVMWNFKGNNIGATGDVKLGYTATKEGSVVTVAFKHSGALPSGTSVTIDMSSSFDAGTVLKVYHIDDDENKTLVTGTATVGTDGKVTIPIASCSSYSFEANDAFSSIVNVGDDGGSDGGINMLLVGGGIAAVAVIGVGAFLFMRRQ